MGNRLKNRWKRYVSFLLALILLLSTTACAGSGENPESGQQGESVADTEGFRVGFGRADITPEEAVPMSGYSDSLLRISTGFLNYLMATCVAITDEDNKTILLFSADLGGPEEKFTEDVRAEVSEATGVPKENIMVSGTHTHSSADYLKTAVENVQHWREKLFKGFVEAATVALQDRKVAEMKVATVKTEKMTFVRRYRKSDGTYTGDGVWGGTSASVVDYESVADPDMQLIKFVRKGKDIILTNFQTHPTITGGAKKYDLSSDFIGAYRECLEKELDCHVSFWNGAAGNLNPRSRFQGETFSSDYVEYGEHLAKYAVDAEKTYKDVKTGKVGIKKINYQGEVYHGDDHLVSEAQQINAIWKSTGDQAKSMAVYSGNEIESVYHAKSLISRANQGAVRELEINALSIGDVGFITAPYEMFDTNGMNIKQQSPFAMTFIMCYTNGTLGYVPSVEGFAHGGYEKVTCVLSPGSGEKLQDTFLDMLKELHGK